MVSVYVCVCVCMYVLGESWGHASTVRVVLSWSDNERQATLVKSPTHRTATAPFVITVGPPKLPLFVCMHTMGPPNYPCPLCTIHRPKCSVGFHSHNPSVRFVVSSALLIVTGAYYSINCYYSTVPM